MNIYFTDVCFITNDVLRLRSFYETLFECKSEGDEIHSFVHVPGFGIAIYSKQKAADENPFTSALTVTMPMQSIAELSSWALAIPALLQPGRGAQNRLIYITRTET